MRKLIVFFLLVSCKTPEKEWVSLIKNNSLDGWHIFQDNRSKTGWYVENEILIFDKISGLESGEDDSSLLSNKTYTSFEITFDWKIEEGGNSGFMWGVSDKKEYKYPYQTGPEIQIIDPSVYEKPQDVLGGDIELNNVLTDLEEKKHFLGSVYDLFSPVSNFSYNPVGEWNNYFIRIDQENNLGSVKLNGIIINEFPLKGPEWNSAISKSKFNNSNEYPYLGDKRWYDFGKFSEGFICFQDHPGKAYFKNIKIRELR